MGESRIMATKHFECDECGARGKIVLKSDNQADECALLTFTKKRKSMKKSEGWDD